MSRAVYEDDVIKLLNRGLRLGMYPLACDVRALPPAQPEISRIEQELHGKTPEEQYEFLYWLLLKFGLTYTDSRLAVIGWLRGEEEDERHEQQTGSDYIF